MALKPITYEDLLFHLLRDGYIEKFKRNFTNTIPHRSR